MAFLSNIFGKKNKDEKKSRGEEIMEELRLIDESDEELTEEEIAAAEQFEAENGEQFVNETSLDVDGQFVDYESLIDDDEQEYDESVDESDDNDEEALADIEALYGDGDADDAQDGEVIDNDNEDEEDEDEKVSFWERLKMGLSKTKNALFGGVHDLLSNFVRVDEDLLDELEELLIMADLGVAVTEAIIDELRDRIKDGRLKEKDQVVDTLKEILGEMIGEHQTLRLETTPSVILVIGVNGAGKTTSIGKISKRLRLAGKKVVVAAADTFRAAAIDQLEIWCKRAKVDIVKQQEGSDPAAVVFDAISYAKKKEADVLIIDTAGRLHNKQNLMNELAKINRVIDRELPMASRENLLVLDATTGQNAVIQAKEFSKAANITGITLNKLDGTAKGGIVISIKQELGIPVKFIGVGEKIDDMQEFDAKQFIDALFE
ncbi:MAG: signal recognition particle-docking protein FtsY [Ruminococcaceae bacterium]|nr:signal recognition particle-docking protein FtsY [Oscillospiraceae bacterium]